MSVKIVNIIASTKILGNIDIEFLNYELNNIQYEPGIFPGLIYRKTGYTIIMFYSGKISSHGTKSEKDAKKAINETLDEIDLKRGIIGNKKHENIKIENMVGTCKIRENLDLELLSRELIPSMYEPEQFPGLLFRPYDNQITCLIFASGKIVIVGSKSKKQLEQTYLLLLNKINEIEGS